VADLGEGEGSSSGGNPNPKVLGFDRAEGPMKLVIVESPNKCKKIGGYLGTGYRLVATVGHFRDLPARELAVDLATMLPTYEVDRKKADVVRRLRSEAAKAEEVLIATDPDREGEAIGWHAAQVLGLESPKRIEFHEITKAALEKAVANPRAIDQALVDAQQARRVLDRLVGYKVSPLLRPLGKGLSAGRVQTATLHLVCQRERDRLAFQSEPFWVLKVTYENGLVSELAEESGKPRRPRDPGQLDGLLAAARRSPHLVAGIERREVEKRPPPPFTTSTLQQAASARLGLVPARTMQVAQELFEEGHISYHRTDSVALSPEAVALARLWVSKHFPLSFPDTPPVYKSKAGAQEAHEAIRPTSLAHPEGLTEDQKKLFELIRARFLASQMKPARLARTLVLTRSPAGDGSEALTFAARGTEVLEAHWLHLDKDDRDEGPADQGKGGKGKKDTSEDDMEEQKLPEVREGQALEVREAGSQKKETKPQARFTEAGLVKEMEKLGVGRPSTYAATIDTLHRRSYVKREKKALAPTELGLQVDDLMLLGLPDLTSHEYTAGMELELDGIADGKRAWQEYLKTWWAAFLPRLEQAGKILAAEIRALRRPGGGESAAGDPACPSCGARMVQRKGRTGPFWGCSTYPACRGTRPIEGGETGKRD
jgi:DNA topoisomerase I